MVERWELNGKAMGRALFEYVEDRKKWAFTESGMDFSY